MSFNNVCVRSVFKILTFCHYYLNRTCSEHWPDVSHHLCWNLHVASWLTSELLPPPYNHTTTISTYNKAKSDKYFATETLCLKKKWRFEKIPLYPAVWTKPAGYIMYEFYALISVSSGSVWPLQIFFFFSGFVCGRWPTCGSGSVCV